MVKLRVFLTKIKHPAEPAVLLAVAFIGQWIVDNPLLAGAALVAAFFACILYVFRAALHDSDVPRRQW